ncbi:hypothetical protein PLICRDRAFT_134105 [Plicaturopsis crispa FD-325 SS-3]|nr:hypothetical protein PLICRDRAFT_134105 [Plicaturopsis crispa FD-325 SS-3]
MSGLERLASTIYHEKQQEGSMLCAQHALNSLLQGNYFTAVDLSDIARHLDSLEQNFDDANNGSASTNMDDTGFFSIQVLENALQVWGLNLVRWRSEDMKPYQDRPHTQLAFVLNFQQHWFTLRRFGHAVPDLDADEGNGHWFNLNSFLPAPEWVGKLYLGMVLQQAEQEGYSVFAVVQQDPSAPLALPRTEADDIASTLPEPTSVARTSGARLTTARDPSAVPAATQHLPETGFEDEDMELQAALQASLMADSSDFTLPHPVSAHSSAPASGSRTPMRSNFPVIPGAYIPDTELSEDPSDPVAASMARNRAMLDRMRREQEMALQEGYEEEIARAQGGQHPGSGAYPGFGARPPVAEEDDEDELFRQAIRDSEADNNAQRDDDDMEVDDSEYRPSAPRIPVSAPGPAFGGGAHRVYDDDDAELQAALKASLEQIPEGFVLPESPPRVPPSHPPPAQLVVPQTHDREQSEDNSEAGSEADASLVSSDAPEPEENLDMDEVRKRRLARFGG